MADAPIAAPETTAPAARDPQPVEPVETNDLGRRYGERVESRRFEALVEQARARAAAFEAPQAEDRTGADTPPASERPSGRLEAGEDAAGAAAELREGAVPQTTPKDAAADVVRGVGETPRAAVRGVVKGAEEIVTAFKHAAEWAVGQQLGADPDMDPVLPDAPQSFTGGLVEDVAQFLAGFGIAGKAMKAAGIGKAKSGAGGIAQIEARAAASDALAFDADEQNLSAFLRAHADLQDPVTAFLATDPEDNEAVNRLRRALEGAGIGVAADGLVRAFSFYRTRRAAKRAGAGPSPAARDALTPIPERDFLILGDPNAPLFEVRAAAPTDGSAKVREGLAATEGIAPQNVLADTTSPGGEEIFVNFARIDAGDDIRAVMGQMADLFAGSIDQARRGVQSHAETERLADALGLSVADLLARRRGQPFNAEQAVAARRLWAASAAKLVETAQAASRPNAGPVDQFNFRKMMAIHYAVQAEVIGARTETARALNAWKIPAGGGEQAKSVQRMLEAYGGPEASAAMAKRLALLAANGAPPEAIAGFVRKGWSARTLDAIKESFVNGLLWSPKTHLVNMASNTMVAAMQIAERGVAGHLSRSLGREAGEGVAPGEGLAMLYGLVQGQKDALRLAAKALASGEHFDALGKIDLSPEPSIDARAFATERQAGRVQRGEVSQAQALADVEEFAETGLGRAIDFYGTATRIPGRLLGAEDAYFKTVGYRMELHASALRQAVAEGHSGPAAARRMMEIVQDPPEHIRMAAADAALYNTFTQPAGPVAQWAVRGRQLGADGPFGALNPLWLVLPFLRTPTNILRYTFERTPLAPLVGQWRADVAAGGARRDIALARMATGSAIMMTVLDYASSGYVSGPGPVDHRARATLERQGWQANSVWVADGKGGGEWVSYQRTDPFGMLAGVAAGIAEIAKTRELSPEDADELAELMALSVAAIGATVVDKTYFTGIANLVQAIEEPERYGAPFVERTLASLVPFSVLLSTVEGAIDPKYRDANSVLEFVQSRLPVLSESLPLKMDIWGRTRGPDEVYGKAYETLSPARATRFRDSPIDAELGRLGMTLSQIPKKTAFAGADINFRDWPRVYEAYVKLAGNGVPHPVWKMGAKDYLDAVVSGKHETSALYDLESDGEDGGKAGFIQDAIREYRRLAQEAILADPDFADFAAHVAQRKAARDAARAPAGMGIPAVPAAPAPSNESRPAGRGRAGAPQF